MDDDVELEVTDLRTGKPRSPRRFVRRTAPSPGPLPPDPERDETDVEDVPFPTPHSRARVARGVLAAAAVVLVVMLLLTTIPNSQVSLGALLRLPTPPPTQPLAPLANSFYAVNTVPWGTLTADGRDITGLVTTNGQPMPFILSRGHHTLQYQAAPFKTVRCTVDVPSGGKDTCTEISNAQSAQVAYQVQLQGDQRAIDLGAVPSKLPPEELRSLTAATQQSLISAQDSTQLVVGDHYLASDQTVAVATEPMQASVVYTLNTDPSRATAVQRNLPGPNGTCVAICDSPMIGIPGNTWALGIHVIVSWQYSTEAGRTFAGPAFSRVTDQTSPQFYDNQPDAVVLVSAQRNESGWQVHTLYLAQMGICALADPAASALITSVLVAHPEAMNSSSQGMQPAPNPADGCLMEAQFAGSKSSLDDVNVALVYRCGVFLPVGATPRDWFPDLPDPSEHELILGKQLIGQFHV